MFEQWLRENGYDLEALNKPENAKQKKHLEAAYTLEQKGKETDFDATRREIHQENERVVAIREATASAMRVAVGNRPKLERLEAIGQAAISGNWDLNRFRLEMLREERTLGTILSTPTAQAPSGDLLEAALCMRGGMSTSELEKEFPEQTLHAAEKRFTKDGIGLKQILLHSARANGYRGDEITQSSLKDVMRYAFRDQGDANEMYAGSATVPSTYSLPNIFANVANKFLRIGFMFVDQTWSRISARRNFNDFKTATTVGLTGSLIYSKLAPSGEIKHGDVAEVVYTNKADTYARMLAIARTDIINDDTGALSTAARRLGRGAALTINRIFWGVFLNNSSFFAAGNNNVITGGTSVLASAGLKLADAKFRVQSDPNGVPLGATPAILLVPPTLAYAGRELMNSSFMIGSTTADALKPMTNIFQGAYRLETSPYMEDSTLTGNSNAAWYILADPNDIPVIEIGFVGGNEAPTVETAEAEFNVLGIAMRGYTDFGVALQEFRGGVRAAGS